MTHNETYRSPRQHLLATLCLAMLSIIAQALPATFYADSSRLATGTWRRVAVTETGIYKITYDQLQEMGFDNPDLVGVYGYGGRLLAEDFTHPYYDDLPEVHIYKEYGNDDTFGAGDYILFYGQGTTQWHHNSTSGNFEHTTHHYSLEGHYFLTQGDTPPSEIATRPAPTDTGGWQEATLGDAYYLHETDEVSVAKSGRELYGENFTYTNTQSFEAYLPGVIESNGTISMSFISKNAQTDSVILYFNDHRAMSRTIRSTTNSHTKAREVIGTEVIQTTSKQNNKVSISYMGKSTMNTRLNYFRIQYKQRLEPREGGTLFRRLKSINSPTIFRIKASSDAQVWDVTNANAPMRLETTTTGSDLLAAAEADDKLHEYALIEPTKPFLEISDVMTVANQNLHAIDAIEMAIITPEAFLPQAKRLAQEHNLRNGLRVAVMTPQQIYNEYSSGTPDATAYRRMMKMWYDRHATTPEHRPRYLLLFGDGAYDNRMITYDWQKYNPDDYLLTYQSYNSLVETSSYVTDDYFGFLDDNTGTNIASDTIRIGIGRFTVRTPDEAKTAVDKIITYMDNAATGSWKSNITIAADDGDMNLHMEQADKLATIIEEEHPEFITNKVYLDAFQKTTVGGKESYPDATIKLERLFKEGQLLFNYTGHGSHTTLSSEGLVTTTSVAAMRYPQWPLWITAACDYTRFDDIPVSGGEGVFLNPHGAGIGLFSTSRVVYSGPNFTINKEMIKHVFSRDANGRRLALGDIIRESKVAMGNDNNKLNFMLVGDPALTLGYPEHHIAVTHINGEAIDTLEAIQFRALDNITIEGEVRTPAGDLDPHFSGDLYAKIFDSKQKITCLNNGKAEKAFTYYDYPNLLFNGQDDVRHGKFSLRIVIPKDISYSNNSGKINLYAASDDSNKKEAQGAFLDFIVGGTSHNLSTDSVGPMMTGFHLNDATVGNGDKVNDRPVLYVHLYDSSGINVSGNGLGHDLTLRIYRHDKLSQTLELNDYFTSDAGSHQSGSLTYMLPTLDEGRYTLEFTAWDMLNNPSKHIRSMEIVKDLDPRLIEIGLLQNPVRDEARFLIHHNRPETTLNVGITIYDFAGRMLWQHKEQGQSSINHKLEVRWNLIGTNGMRLPPGVYLYRVDLGLPNANYSSETKKIVILSQ